MPSRRGQHDNLKLRISTGGKNFGLARSEATTWGRLRDRLANPLVDSVTHREFKALEKKEQDRRKAMAGWFVGGDFQGRKRKAQEMRERSLLTIDIDEGDHRLAEALDLGLSPISSYEFFVHSTRKHTPKAPRLRVIVPLKRPIPAEMYAPLARIFSSMLLDDSRDALDAVDPVSYRPAQFMFWPTANKNSPYVADWNRGELLDARAFLDDWGDWKDWTKLPTSSKREDRPGDPKAKKRDPRELRGYIGAVCRAYPIEDAIAEFLPDVYVECDAPSGKPRYTHVEGSTEGGAIVEDDGLFLYSHHATDPCGGQLVNTWDMLRLHLFGDLDEGARPGTTPTALPSHKALVEFFQDREDERVLEELVSGQLGDDAFEDLGPGEPGAEAEAKTEAEAEHETRETGFDDLDALDDLVGPDPSKREAETPPKGWGQRLELDQNGHIKPTLPNLNLLALYHPLLHGKIAYNQHKDAPVLLESIEADCIGFPKLDCTDAEMGTAITDNHIAALTVLFSSRALKGGRGGLGVQTSKAGVRDALLTAALNRPFNPVTDRMTRISWDGVPRLRSWLPKYLKVEDNAYHREVGRLVFLGIVARAFEPGHKFDQMLILEGSQGSRKSTLCEVMSLGFFSTLNTDLTDAKALVEQTSGTTVVEIAELQGFKNKELERIKSMLTTRKDRVRKSHMQYEQDYPRRNIFIGTTNDSSYLRDKSGNRRFWPVKLGTPSIDIDGFRAELEQLYAEAVAEYRQMRETTPLSEQLPLYLTDPEAQAQAIAAQERVRVEDEVDWLMEAFWEWFNKPLTRSQVDAICGGTDAGFDDLDDEDDGALYQRVCTYRGEILQECFGISDKDNTRSDYITKRQVMEGLALSENLICDPKSQRRRMPEDRQSDLKRQLIYRVGETGSRRFRPVRKN